MSIAARHSAQTAAYTVTTSSEAHDEPSKFGTHGHSQTPPPPPDAYWNYAVRDGGKFFLWDPQGSPQTNGGSWVATNLGGYTYPGFGGYWYYLQFKGHPAHKRPQGGTAVTLEIAQVEPPSPLPNYRGLKVSGDYIWNEDNEDTIDVIFVPTGCHDDDNDAVDV
ncbi:hypothetical protein ABZX51_008391 [Aspergillus tubingensis]